MANQRALGEVDWLHGAVTEWTAMDAGETRSFRAPIGGYVLVRSGEVEVSPTHGKHATLKGPAKAPVGGGNVSICALTEAQVALGSVTTYVGVVIDVDAGYASDLWDTLGANEATRSRAHYGQR